MGKMLNGKCMEWYNSEKFEFECECFRMLNFKEKRGV